MRNRNDIIKQRNLKGGYLHSLQALEHMLSNFDFYAEFHRDSLNYQNALFLGRMRVPEPDASTEFRKHDADLLKRALKSVAKLERCNGYLSVDGGKTVADATDIILYYQHLTKHYQMPDNTKTIKRKKRVVDNVLNSRLVKRR